MDREPGDGQGSLVMDRGAGDGQGSLARCSPRGCKELDMTQQLNNDETAQYSQKQHPQRPRC